ncbi:MAG TPA: DUF6537 domain-containing protein [Noviherbaspirillum sp.]|uniref:DUF6537 domain-containing protein n=1 Tax=Noviherbaspirillum sp. TaxID=1926288 RepID=UPI002B48B088|nr:DUF6537 domain-containing protein [Noviherbaspirillum sp.]HJV84988.1 DUF6537 domain-containing protein [Noviherbaspirillum sp.]
MENLNNNRTRRILIGTVGGQGGGVLSAWLVRGLINHGWDAISIGLLGLSQRAGTVTYYCEAAPKSEQRRVNSVFAMAGDVDLLIGQELLELGRLVQSGYAAQDCVIIGNTYRYLTTLEKMPSEDGIFGSTNIVNAVNRIAPQRNFLVHAQEVVSTNQLPALTSNAFLLGAAVGSPVFSLPPEPFLEAIRADQVAVETNSKAFLLGYEMARDGRLARLAEEERLRISGAVAAPAKTATQLVFQPGPQFLGLLQRASDNAAAHDTLVSIGNLLEVYQNADYADEFARKVTQCEQAFQQNVPGHAAGLFEPLCLNLANWMAYEDTMRVAQIKSSPDRFARLASEFRNAKGIVEVRDYMVPDLEQFLDALPPALERLFRKPSDDAKREHASSIKFPVRLRSNGVIGYWSLRLLAAFRWTRPFSSRHVRETKAMQQWLDAIAAAAREDVRIALVLAEAGRIVKGYGWTRKKAMADIEAFVTEGAGYLSTIRRQGGDPLSIGREALAKLAQQAGNWPQCEEYLKQAASAQSMCEAVRA